MTTDLAFKSATELVALYRAREASPVEAAKAALAQIARLNPTLNAFRLVDEESALAAARASEARWMKDEPAGLVDGVPTSVKDLVLTKGWSTLRGSKTVDPDQPWPDDAPAVARLREHGAVLLGKTTTPEYGWKGATDSPLTGITRNPWNTERTPGGSSGGAAVAAVTGMGALHVGTDGGGSIRIPSSLTGLYGIKATFGRVPTWPPSPFGTLANLGPMTRTVPDAALMLSVIARPDARDWYALPPADTHYVTGLEHGVKGMRIGYAATPGGVKAEPEVARLVADAVAALESMGAVVETAEPPLEGVGDIFMKHWFCVAAEMMGAFSDAQQAEMDPGLLHCAAIGATFSRSEYMAALDGRQALGYALHQFMQNYDVLVLPTLPVTAFPVGQVAPKAVDSEREWVDWTPWTYPFNLSRQPAASIPCGLSKDGLPVGLQIVGPLYGEKAVLRVSRAFEKARPWPLPPMAKAS
jgi:aspartyl-tRNA(Asn)/glutamyl-tRNA(Gln) amidotransferase subunit A